MAEDPTKLKLNTKKKKSGGPSTLSRVFDILSRGQYASAEGVRRVLEPGGGSGLHDVMNFLKGADLGLSGKAKTSYSQVLGEHGVKGPLKAIGGLAGDVLLDPSTYLTFGATKAGEVALAKTAGAKALGTTTEAIGKGVATKSVERAGMDAVIEAGEKAVRRGKKLPTEKQLANVKHQAMVDKAAEEGIQAARSPGSIQMKFMGQEIGSSKKAYDVAAFIGNKAGATGAGKALSTAFRTASKYPGMSNVFKREAEQAGFARLDEAHKEIDAVLKGFSKADQRRVSHAIEAGEDLLGELGEHGNDLGTLQRTAKEMQDKWYQLEKGIGLFPDQIPRMTNKQKNAFNKELKRLETLKSTTTDVNAIKGWEKAIKAHKAKLTTPVADPQYLDDYVYHYYKKGKGTQVYNDIKGRRKIRAVGSESPGFTKTRSLPTLDVAKGAGLEPVEEIGDILKLRAAKHQNALARQNFVEKVSELYGVRITDKSTQRALKKQGLRSADSKYVDKSLQFPDTIAKAIEGTEKLHLMDDESAGFAKLFDTVQNKMKFALTSANPGHHVRNLVGDSWLNWLDGVKDPRHYDAAIRILMPNNLSDNSKMVLKIGKGQISGEEMWRLYGESGARSGMIRSEFGGTSQSWLEKKINPLSEKREDMARLAHFIHAIKEEGAHISKSGALDLTDDTLKDAAAKAAMRVRKWNIDYGDVTDIERRYIKRAIPFYTFMRKNMPLQVEAALTKPGKIAGIPKGVRTIEQLLGNEPSEYGGLESVPLWIKEMAPLNLRAALDGENALYMVSPTPFHEAGKAFTGGPQGMLKNLLSMTTPVAKIPFELGTGRQIFNDAPTPGLLEYILNQAPISRNVGRMITDKEGPGLKGLNWLTGAGVQEVTPKLRRGEIIRQRTEAKKERKAARK